MLQLTPECSLFIEFVLFFVMSEFEKISVEEARSRIGRRSKTTPLRDEILSMQAGDAISVSFYNSETGDGYKPTTVAQVVSQMSKDGELRYSMRKNTDGDGCFVMCIAKTPEDALRPKRGRKPKNQEVVS